MRVSILLGLLFFGLLGCSTLTTDDSHGEKILDPGFQVISQEAKKGNADAQFRLGIAYLNGYYGLQADPVAAADLFELAALQNHSDAQYFLAETRLTGIGVKQDLVEAFAWLLIAKEKSFLAAENIVLFNSILEDKYRDNQDAFAVLHNKVTKQISIKKEQIKQPPHRSEKLPPITPQNLIFASGYANFIQQVPRFYDHGFELFMQDNPLSGDLFNQVKRVRAEVINPEKLEQQMRQHLEKLITSNEIERGYIWLSSPLVSQVIKAESDATSLEGYQQIIQNGKKNVAQLIDTSHLAVVQRFDDPYLPESRTEERYPAGRIDFATLVALYFRGTTLGTIPTIENRLDPTFEVTEKMLKKHHLTGQATAFKNLENVTLKSYSNLVRSKFGRKLTRAIAASFDATIRESRETYAHNLPDELAVHKPTPDFRIENIQIVNFGLFQHQSKYREESPATTSGKVTLVSGNKIVQKTTQIPAQRGVSFGITYQINSNEQSVIVPVKIRLTHPLITSPLTGKTTSVDEWISRPRTNTPQTDTWHFDELWEVAPGSWTFSVLYRDETNPYALDRILLEKSFLVGENRSLERSPETLAQIEEVDYVLMSGNGRYLAIMEERERSDEVSFWDLSTNNLIDKEIAQHGLDLEPVMFSPTNPNMAITKYDGNSLKVWDLENLNNSFNLLEISGPGEIVQKIFGPAGKYFYVTYDTVNRSTRRRQPLTKVWDLKSKKVIALYSPFMDIVIHPQERYLAGELPDCTIQIWNLETGELAYSDKREGSCRRHRTATGFQQLNIVQTLLTNETAIIFYTDGRCDFIDIQTGKTINKVQIGTPQIWVDSGRKRKGGGRLHLDESGQSLVYAPNDLEMKKELWNARTGTKILSFSGVVKFNADGTKAAVFDYNTETVTIRDMLTGVEDLKIKKKSGTHVTVSSDFKSFAFVRNDYNKTTHKERKSIQVHSLENDATISVLQVYNINAPVFNNDLSKVLITNPKAGNNEILVWDLINGGKAGLIQNVTDTIFIWELSETGQKKLPVVEIENADGTLSLIDPFTSHPVRGEHYSFNPSTKNSMHYKKRLNGLHLLDINNADRSRILTRDKFKSDQKL